MREQRKRTGTVEIADREASNRPVEVGDLSPGRSANIPHATPLPGDQSVVLAVDRGSSLGGGHGECSGKTGYLSWTAAAKALRHMNVKPRKREDKLRPYRCRFCPHWHLGNGVKR